MRTETITKALGLLFILASTAGAQDRGVVRPLGAVTARTAEPIAVTAIRPLPNGVLVNDPRSRRVLLFDQALSSYTIVADSTSATGNAYSGRMGGLLAYRGDSSLFVDPASLSMLVLDPAGKIARVMSVPRTDDAHMLAGPMGGVSYDGRGGIVYRSMPRARMRTRAAGQTGFAPPEFPDSAAVLRIDLATRRLDTLGYIRTPKMQMDVTTTEDGRVQMRSRLNPLPVIDEWAALPDGTIAFVRGRDYHVDWIAPDGTPTSSPKIAFDWQRMTDEDKVAFLDSLKAARTRMAGHAPGAVASVGAALGVTESAMAATPDIQIFTGPGGPGGGPPNAGGQRMNAQVNFVDASELPDYKPAFFAGAVRADTEGNLWVRTIPTKAIPGGPVYDVINRSGALVERIQVPEGRTIVGFGPGGVVYMIAVEDRVSYLEKANIR